jgi:hypothetical protein
MTKRILGTIKRGKVKIRSAKQMRFLHWAKIDHTHISKDGKVTRHTYGKRRKKKGQKR